MSSEVEHIEFANRCQGTIVHLLADPPHHAEWIVTVSFYKAIHVVEAIFAAFGEHSHSHEMRELRLKSERKYLHLYKNYRPLQGASIVARYQCGTSHTLVLNDPKAAEAQFVKHRLRQVENSAEKFLPKELAEKLMRA